MRKAAIDLVDHAPRRGFRHACLVAALASIVAVPIARGEDQLTAFGNALIELPTPTDVTGFGTGLAVGDVGGDTGDDLIIAEAFGERISIHLGSDWTVGNTPPPVATGLLVTTPRHGGVLATGDFDNDGTDEIVIGAPGDMANAGAVYVAALEDAGDLTILETIRAGGGYPGASESGANLGRALAVGDFDDDGFDDLAIGVPRRTVSGVDDAGAVMVAFGSATGIGTSGAMLITRATDGLTFTPTEDDQFGWSLAAEDFDGDGTDDLAIGIPGATCPNGTDRAGGVVMMRGADGVGLVTTGSRILRPGTLGIGGSCATTRGFGYALAAGDFNAGTASDLAIGAPEETTAPANGAVHVVFGGPDGLTSTDSVRLTLPPIADSTPVASLFGLSLATGRTRRCGCSVDGLAVGAPLADIGVGGFNEGAVVLFPASNTEALAQSNHRVITAAGLRSGPPSPNHYFGLSLAFGDFNDDSPLDDLAIGVPYYDRVPTRNGAVQLIFATDQFLFIDSFE